MPKNAPIRPEFLTIRAPKFTLGDSVQYTIDFDDTFITYFGIIQVISWCKDCEDGQRCWEFTVCVKQILHEGKLLKRHDYDQVVESDLEPWIEGGIDTGIDSSIDSSIAAQRY